MGETEGNWSNFKLAEILTLNMISAKDKGRHWGLWFRTFKGEEGNWHGDGKAND